MTQSVNALQSTRSPAPPCGSVIYTHPDEVANDSTLTRAEKRAVLASWVSDARAVESAPSLRRLDSGAVTDVDAILQALISLDEPGPGRSGDAKRLRPLNRRRSVISRLLRRVGPSNGSNDNDDDPPPAPTGLAIPFRPTFVAACARAA